MSSSVMRRAAFREFRLSGAGVVWLLRFGVAGLLLVGLFGPWASETSPLWTAGNVAAVVALGAVAALVPAAKPRFLKRAEAALLGVFILNLAGGVAFALYRRVPAYDLLVHFAGTAAFVYVLYALAEGLPASALWRWGPPLRTGLFAFAFAMAAGGLWEIFEGAVELLPGQEPIRGYYDTVKDLAADGAGALLGALVAARAARRRAEPVARRASGPGGARGSGRAPHR